MYRTWYLSTVGARTIATAATYGYHVDTACP